MVEKNKKIFKNILNVFSIFILLIIWFAIFINYEFNDVSFPYTYDDGIIRLTITKGSELYWVTKDLRDSLSISASLWCCFRWHRCCFPALAVRRKLPTPFACRLPYFSCLYFTAGC